MLTTHKQKNEGFMLPAAMALTGVIGTVALVFTSSINQQATRLRAINVQNQTLSIESQLRSALADPFSCTCTLANSSLTAFGSTPPITDPADDGVAIDEFADCGAGSPKFLRSGEPIEDTFGLDLPIGVDEIRLRVLENFSITWEPGASQIYRAEVVVTLENLGDPYLNHLIRPLTAEMIVVERGPDLHCLGGQMEDYFTEVGDDIQNFADTYIALSENSATTAHTAMLDFFTNIFQNEVNLIHDTTTQQIHQHRDRSIAESISTAQDFSVSVAAIRDQTIRTLNNLRDQGNATIATATANGLSAMTGPLTQLLDRLQIEEDRIVDEGKALLAGVPSAVIPLPDPSQPAPSPTDPTICSRIEGSITSYNIWYTGHHSSHNLEFHANVTGVDGAGNDLFQFDFQVSGTSGGWWGTASVGTDDATIILRGTDPGPGPWNATLFGQNINGCRTPDIQTTFGNGYN